MNRIINTKENLILGIISNFYKLKIEIMKNIKFNLFIILASAITFSEYSLFDFVKFDIVAFVIRVIFIIFLCIIIILFLFNSIFEYIKNKRLLFNSIISVLICVLCLHVCNKMRKLEFIGPVVFLISIYDFLTAKVGFYRIPCDIVDRFNYKVCRLLSRSSGIRNMIPYKNYDIIKIKSSIYVTKHSIENFEREFVTPGNAVYDFKPFHIWKKYYMVVYSHEIN